MTKSGNTVSDDEIIEVLKTHEYAMVKTSEVAEHIALGSQRTGQRLQQLRDDGRIVGRQVGQGYIWAHPDRIKQ